MHLSDGGPFYAETHWENVVKEPFNAATAALFIAIALIWLYRLRSQLTKQPYFLFCFLVLLLGGIGGTLFHALRTSRLFLLLDIFPILILASSLVFRCWWQLTGKHWPGLLFFSGFFVLNRLIFTVVARPMAINLSYGAMAVMVLIPLVLVARKTHWRRSSRLIMGAFLFSSGLWFRSVDLIYTSWFPMGTHWLWHLFSAAAVWFIIEYLVLSERKTSLDG